MQLISMDTLTYFSDCTLDVLLAGNEEGNLGIVYAYIHNGYVKVFGNIQDFYNWKTDGADVDYLELTQDEYNSDLLDKYIIEKFFGVE